MEDPNAYPELILASAQDKIRALTQARAHKDSRRAAKAARHRSRRGPWWRTRVTRSPS